MLQGLVCLWFAPAAFAQEISAPSRPQPLAVLDGQPISEDQLPPKEQTQLQRMMQQVYAVRLRALHTALDPRLLDAEAKRRNLSVEQLLRTEVISRVPDPTPEEVSAYFQQRQATFSLPFEEVKGQIADGMKNVSIQRAKNAYLRTLWDQALADGSLALLIAPPQRIIEADPARTRGDARAPVTIVEFSDFSCVYCQKAEATLSALLAKYPGQLKLAYRDFPITELHPQAELAAEASRCAGAQGKYWQFHDLLFANPSRQTRDDLVDAAGSVGLDRGAFNVCLSSGQFRAQVQQDLEMGRQAGVVSTPGFFVNGTFLNGAQPEPVFDTLIARELAKQDARRPGDKSADGGQTR